MKIEPSDEGPKAALAGFTPLFGGAKIVLAETPKAVTPFGGLCSFIAYLQQIGFGLRVAQTLPFPAPTSPNAIPLAHTFTAFFFAVVTGASRFAHTDWLRGDRALHALLGIARFSGDDTVRAPEGFHLDLDSTIFCREGQQEGARKGYNPRRKGRVVRLQPAQPLPTPARPRAGVSAAGYVAQPSLRRRGDPRTRQQAGRPQIIAGLGWPREA